MQLKGLVRFFAIALILICLYQLSFTWFVRNHENKMEERADSWVRANHPTAEAKYPGNKELQELVQRMNLEKQYKQLMFEDDRRSAGKKFIDGLFGQKRYGGKDKRRYTDDWEEIGDAISGRAMRALSQPPPRHRS